MDVRWAIALLLPLAGCVGEPVPDCGFSNGTPDFCGEASWFNTPQTSLDELEGKVVLVDFWTYSCINCIRTFPHLTAWYDTYAPYGLVIVGVHTPEFDFEKDPANVQAAIDKHGIRYPVVQDNDRLIWKNYENRYWPAHYIIDQDGNSITPGKPWHIGEGGYEETELKLRELLEDAGADFLPPAIEGTEGRGLRGSDITPELYAGYWRQSGAIGNPEGYQNDEVVSYTSNGAPQRDRIYLDGDWLNDREAMVAETNGRIHLGFNAGAVNMVIEPHAADGQCIGVWLDGAPITKALAGPSVSFDGDTPCIELDGPDSYDLYAGPVEEHVLRIEAPQGLALYTFAFSSYPS